MSHSPGNTAANRSSMLTDFIKGSRTEIDAICGEVVRSGREYAVPTPVNEILFELVKSWEATAPDRETT